MQKGLYICRVLEQQDSDHLQPLERSSFCIIVDIMMQRYIYFFLLFYKKTFKKLLVFVRIVLKNSFSRSFRHGLNNH